MRKPLLINLYTGIVVYSKRKKMKHRKTLVKEESWIQLDDWFLGTPPPKDGRSQWHSLGRIWGTCIAHQCPDGNVRAPTSLQIYQRKRKSGGLGVYGRCSGCHAPISKKLKQMITMLEVL